MAQQPGGDKITRNIVIGMVVLVVAVGVAFSVLGNKSIGNAAIPSSVSKADGYGIVFNADLKNKPVVDLWEDFQCPICARFEATNGAYIQTLISEKRAKVVFHILSFIGPESILAANAAACSADESKFLQYHSYLYANQSATENSGLWSNERLIASGSDSGITSSTFKSCISGGKYAAWVGNVAKDGENKKIDSTPTVYVNGKVIDRNTQYFDAIAFAKAVEGK